LETAKIYLGLDLAFSKNNIDPAYYCAIKNMDATQNSDMITVTKNNLHQLLLMLKLSESPLCLLLICNFLSDTKYFYE
jgi:hypothetical protein